MSDNDLQFFKVAASADHGPERQIAFRQSSAASAGMGKPGLIWLGGFKSDMESTKAVALDQWAKREGRACLRFDYSGHGRSSGAFEDGTIGGWLDDALAVILARTQGPQVLIGSSMGAWITLLVARILGQRGEAARLAGMVLLAPAVDFTEALLWAQLSPDIRSEIETTGQWLRPTDYAADPHPVTRVLIEDGRRHLLLDTEIRTFCPVHILQGMRDPDVPWQHAMLLVEHMASDPVSVTLIKDGDHRLSRPEDIERLLRAVDAIA